MAPAHRAGAIITHVQYEIRSQAGHP